MLRDECAPECGGCTIPLRPHVSGNVRAGLALAPPAAVAPLRLPPEAVQLLPTTPPRSPAPPIPSSRLPPPTNHRPRTAVPSPPKTQRQHDARPKLALWLAGPRKIRSTPQPAALESASASHHAVHRHRAPPAMLRPRVICWFRGSQ